MRFSEREGPCRRGRKGLLVCGVAVLLLFACEQDPIFDMISREVKPQEPRIKGVPTKMVVWKATSGGDEAVYVADSSLHRYAKQSGTTQGVWDEGDIPKPEGKIFDLAATTSYLYALVNVDSPELWRLPQGGQWEKVVFASDGGYSRLQSIYGETKSDGVPLTDNLYAGAMNSSGDYAVFHTSGSGGLNLLKTGTGLLTGAASAGTNHYFSTYGGGVYTGTVFSPSDFSSAKSLVVTGMIETNDSTSAIVALCFNGDLYAVSGMSVIGNAGVYFPGAAAVWTKDSKKLLLVALQSSLSSSSATYGYGELDITDGLPGTVTLREPGAQSPSTVDDAKRYRDTIEPKPVNAILQVPASIDAGAPLFASVQGRGTAKDNTDGGLWSYRSRDSGWQWNAEE
jgi:hypothetical protein